MNILIGTSPFCCRDKTASLLQLAGITPSTTLDLVDEQTLSQATVLLANHSVAAIVLYAPLDMALEHAIAQGVPVEQALVSWQQNTSQLVHFYKQHRTGVLLASLAEVFAAPQAFVNACANRWPSLTLDDNGPVSPEVKPAPFYQLLAHALRINVPALQTLSQQLTALTQPLTYHHPAPTSLPVDVGELVSHYQNAVSAQKKLPVLMEQLHTLQQEYEQEKQKLDKQQQENQLLLEQLFAVQEELDSRLQEHDKQRAYQQQQQQALIQQLEKKQQAHVKDKQELQNQNARLQGQWNTLQQEYEQEKQKQDELRQENQLLLEQLFAVQEELESHYLASRQQESQQQPVSSSSNDQHTHNTNVSLIKRQLQKWATKKALRRKLADLHNSTLFDPKWYLAQYPDIATDVKFRKNPALHYLKFGGFEGRNPSPHFNSAAYLALNPDVQAEGVNPLLHYLRFGQEENRHTG